METKMNTFTKTLMAGVAMITLSMPASADPNVRSNVLLGADTGVVAGNVGVNADMNTRTDVRTNRVRADNRVRVNNRNAVTWNEADMNTNARLNSNARVNSNARANVNANAYANANPNARFMDDYDMSRADVMDLQRRLDRAGYDLSVDGMMGARTRAAIREYQMENNLNASGALDNATLDLLNSGTIRSRTAADLRNSARLNATGNMYDFNTMSRADIRDLQMRLDRAGYNLSADGVAGARTRAAIRSYQQANNLRATGMLNAETMASLNN